jgi:dihydroneopterin aldolase
MVYSNENLTDEIAERLIAEYPNLKRDNVIVEVPGYEAPKPEADQAETPAPKKKSAKKEPK